MADSRCNDDVVTVPDTVRVGYIVALQQPRCLTVPNLIKISQIVLRYRYFSIFQDDDCPPSWICLERIWTTHNSWWSLSLCKIWLWWM